MRWRQRHANVPSNAPRSSWPPNMGLLVFVALVAFQVYALYIITPGSGASLPYADKLAHAAMFATPAALAAALKWRWAVLFLVVHALASEPLQGALTTTRQADAWDAVADLIGIVLGVAAVRQWRSDRPRLAGEGTS